LRPGDRLGETSERVAHHVVETVRDRPGPIFLIAADVSAVGSGTGGQNHERLTCGLDDRQGCVVDVPLARDLVPWIMANRRRGRPAAGTGGNIVDAPRAQ
jgi:hypothetical protein